MSEARPHDPCPHIGLAASYVLGALEPEESDGYERHLIECPVCRDEVGRLQPAVDSLAQAVSPTRAPEGLRDRVMAQVRAEAELLRTAGPGADQPARGRLQRRLGAVAAIACLACGIGIGVLVSGSASPIATRTLQAHVAPTAGAGHAQLIRAGGRAELLVSHFPPPPLGKIYQVWVVRGALAPQPTDALFSVNAAGSGSVAVPENLDHVRRVMVTAEPLGGSTRPTSAPVITVTL